MNNVGTRALRSWLLSEKGDTFRLSNKSLLLIKQTRELFLFVNQVSHMSKFVGAFRPFEVKFSKVRIADTSPVPSKY